MKKSEIDMNNPVHRICTKLNELFELDPIAFNDLSEHRVPVSSALADHPGIPVTQDARMGVLSLLNAVIELEFGEKICGVFGDDDDANPGLLKGFRPLSDTKPKKPEDDRTRKVIAASLTSKGSLLMVTASRLEEKDPNITFWLRGRDEFYAPVSAGPMSGLPAGTVWPRAAAVHMGAWWEDHKAQLECMTAAAFNGDYPGRSVWFSDQVTSLPYGFKEHPLPGPKAPTSEKGG
jgi:hypothetical protein